VTVLIRLGEESVELSISDDGVGFALTEVRNKKERGIGLILMRERVKELGGEFHMDSEPNKGTRVELTLPVVIAEGKRRA
jgi:NarL family two-component system sensor histidine kinase LiaS